MQSANRSDFAPQFLLIERDPASVRALGTMVAGLPGEPVTLVHAKDGRDGLGALKANGFDVVLADATSLGDISGSTEDAISRISRVAGSAIVVVLSEAGSVSAAVAAMRSGAHDYLAKPISTAQFAARVCELAHRHGNARALAVDGRSVDQPADFGGFVGGSEQMQVIYDQIRRIAPSPAPVFITGESGTGKELCAEALHTHGPRSAKPFVAINCGAIPGELMESAIFGAARGSYTGATEDRPGAAETADGGVLFLDEIGEMDMGLQSKLLRFLQTGTVTRIGENHARTVDVRVICATNRNPMQLIAERRFREDLFYRLHVLPIHLPPLRQRAADILPLARTFLHRYAEEEGKAFTGFSQGTADLFVAREWPGNVRQVQNLIRRIVVMFDGTEITAEMVAAADIESRGRQAQTMAMQVPQSIEPMWRQEKQIIESALSRFGGNIAAAAAALQISPSTIYRKRQSWEEMEQLAGAA